MNRVRLATLWTDPVDPYALLHACKGWNCYGAVRRESALLSPKESCAGLSNRTTSEPPASRSVAAAQPAQSKILILIR